ncbi:hypothetical protein AAMO2058_000165700 [Amorphochlora amoebiformis]
MLCNMSHSVTPRMKRLWKTIPGGGRAKRRKRYRNRDEAYLKAAKEGNWVKMEKALAEGATPLARELGSNNTAMILAASQNHREIVRNLVSKGEDVNAQNCYGVTALIYATRFADVRLVRLLIPKADVNHKTKVGTTALMEAVLKSKNEIVTVLIEAKAKIDAQNNTGKTALMYAAKRRCWRSVRSLVKANADPNLVDVSGRTALTIFCLNLRKGMRSEDHNEYKILVDLVEKANADPGIAEISGKSCMAYAMLRRQWRVLSYLNLAWRKDMLARAVSRDLNSHAHPLQMIHHLIFEASKLTYGKHNPKLTLTGPLVCTCEFCNSRVWEGSQWRPRRVINHVATPKVEESESSHRSLREATLSQDMEEEKELENIRFALPIRRPKAPGDSGGVSGDS